MFLLPLSGHLPFDGLFKLLLLAIVIHVVFCLLLGLFAGLILSGRKLFWRAFLVVSFPLIPLGAVLPLLWLALASKDYSFEDAFDGIPVFLGVYGLGMVVFAALLGLLVARSRKGRPVAAMPPPAPVVEKKAPVQPGLRKLQRPNQKRRR